MKYSEFILRVRARLTDMRQPDNTPIDAANLDGKRWTAEKLGGICKDAIHETVRLIATYSREPILQQMGSQNIVTRVELTTNTDGEVALVNDMITILSVTGEQKTGYGYINPEKFQQYRNTTSFPRKDEQFYTVFYDLMTEKNRLAILPTSKKKLTVYAIYSDSNFNMVNIHRTIPLRGLDDLLVDVAEREAREQEGNLGRAQILDKRIFIKLGIGLGGS